MLAHQDERGNPVTKKEDLPTTDLAVTRAVAVTNLPGMVDAEANLERREVERAEPVRALDQQLGPEDVT